MPTRALVVLIFLPLSWSAFAESGYGHAVENVLVLSGAAGDSFTMGDGTVGPNVRQTISYDFHISRHPITNAEFAEFMEDGGYGTREYWTVNGWRWKGRTAKPAHWAESDFNGPLQPIVGVTWYEAVAYCNWRSAKEGLDLAYDASGRPLLDKTGYRLPTEVEWEYAAAKGGPGASERVFPWGDTWRHENLSCSVPPLKRKKTAAVGSYSPRGDTPQGVAEMSGNVWEWCCDNAQRDTALHVSIRTDRCHFNNDAPYMRMMLRGGSWGNDFVNGFRCSFRGFFTSPSNRYNVIGFRVVRRSATD